MKKVLAVFAVWFLTFVFLVVWMFVVSSRGGPLLTRLVLLIVRWKQERVIEGS